HMLHAPGIAPELAQHMQRKQGDTTASFDELLRQFEILILPGDAIQAEQSDLDLLMATGLIICRVEEITDQEISSAQAHVQQIPPARRFKVRNACFDQV